MTGNNQTSVANAAPQSLEEQTWKIDLGDDGFFEIPKQPIGIERAIECLNQPGACNVYFRADNKTGLMQDRLWEIIGNEEFSYNIVVHRNVKYIGVCEVHPEGDDLRNSERMLRHLAPFISRLQFKRTFSRYRDSESEYTLVVSLVDIEL